MCLIGSEILFLGGINFAYNIRSKAYLQQAKNFDSLIIRKQSFLSLKSVALSSDVNNQQEIKTNLHTINVLYKITTIMPAIFMGCYMTELNAVLKVCFT